jgi:uncharacterized membrane protein
MQLVPEWAPNIHPMFVHFPIALLFTAVAVDFLALVVRPWRWLRPAAVTIYVLGAVSTIVTYFTGKAAADSVTLPAEAQTVLTTHANLAWWTMWAAGLYALGRLGTVFYERTRRSVWTHGALFVIALIGLYLPYQTGDHGSMMVYKHGVGVQTANVGNPAEHDHSEHGGGDGAASDSTSGSGLEMSPGGGWRWQPGKQAASAMSGSAFTWHAGEASALNPEMQQKSGEQGLALSVPRGQPVMFTADDPLRSVQAETRLNLSNFEGTAMLVHHVQDESNYDFVALGGGTMRIGRVRGGQTETLAEGSYEQSGWLPVRLVSDKDHYRGYVGSEMIAHGHEEAPPSGPVGLRLEGSGTALLGRMTVQSLRGGGGSSEESGSGQEHDEGGESGHSHSE